MTDNEIIKALEEYRNSKIVQSDNGVISIGNILDLIARQKEQIESLIAGQETLQKALDEKIAEVERLKKDLKDCIKEVAKSHEIDRNKAIIEFAERLKEKAEYFWEEKESFVPETDIDNLVKEMVGE